MAQTGYTPILIYSSSTASNTPLAGSLTNSTLGSELAINITDGKLFYKDNANAVQVIGWKTTPTSAGGTGLTSYTAGDLLYYASGTALSKLAIGGSGYYISSTGTAPQWSAPAALTKTDDTNVTLTLGGSASTALLNAASLTLGWTGQLGISRGGTNATATPTAGAVAYGTGTAYAFTAAGTSNQVLISNGASAPTWASLSSVGVSSFSAGTTGLTPNSATTGAVTLAGTLATTNGGTGLTAFTANQLFYASSTSAVGQSANLTFDGTTFTSALKGTIGSSAGSGAALSSTNPAKLFVSTASYTDTASSGTVANGPGTAFGAFSIAASNATTYTNAATVFISGAPTAGSNVTLTNKYALFVNSGLSYFGGALGLGVTASTDFGVRQSYTATGSTSGYGFYTDTFGDSGTTNTLTAFRGRVRTSAAAYTLSQAYVFFADLAGIGASSAITTYGSFAAQDTTSGPTNIYGFYGQITQGSGKYNLYMSGTADNYFNGNTYPRTGTTSMTDGFFYISAAAGAPSGTPTAVSGRVPMYYDTTNNKFYVYNGAWKSVALT